ncbi:MAG: DEAD/DEAH box helicase [Myxococcota bacterium]
MSTLNALPVTEQPASFDSFNLDPRILERLSVVGFEAPTAIQARAIPPLLAGQDMIGRARTGSGKTAAFGIPLLERMKAGGPQVRSMVLTPTRELALQVTQALRDLAGTLPVRVVPIYGGAPYGPQLDALRSGVAVVVGTPGRVVDHLDRGTLDISTLEMLVLDEADEMLRMGFFEDVERVIAGAPQDRQVAMFSATMPEAIRRVVERRLPAAVEIQVERAALTVDHIEQRALLVPEKHKVDALRRVLASEPITAAVVFTRTRAGCAEAADRLASAGLSVDALHGDLNQAARERVLNRFRAGRLKVVVATDVAARGIDVEHVSHVINYDLPNDAESYVHRIGRTGRAGRSGVAISLVAPREASRIRNFERALRADITKMNPPSDAEIVRAERRRLIEGLKSSVASDLVGSATPLLEELLPELEVRQLALAALYQLAEVKDVRLDTAIDDAPPKWFRELKTKKSAERRPRADGGSRTAGVKGSLRGDSQQARRRAVDEAPVELFLPIGRTRGVRPADLVGALAGDAGIESVYIGKVTILDQMSFVNVRREEGEALLRGGVEVQVRGRMVPISRARQRGDSSGSGSSGSGSRASGSRASGRDRIGAYPGPKRSRSSSESKRFKGKKRKSQGWGGS